jgi:HAD superfamily hydrolase (TIGR01509 family)
MNGNVNPSTAANIPFPQGILWDMDGVIIDSGDLHYKSWIIAMEKYFPEVAFTEELFKLSFGKNNKLAIPSMVGHPVDDELVEEVSVWKEELYRDMLHGNIEFLPGVQALMQAFKKHAIPQAVGTSAPAFNMEMIRKELKLDDYIDRFISAAYMPSKPDPAVFLKAAESIQRDPHTCVVFEDAIAGVQAGINAGAQVIAVTTTYPQEKLSHATLVVNRLDEIDFHAWLDQ